MLTINPSFLVGLITKQEQVKLKGLATYHCTRYELVLAIYLTNENSGNQYKYFCDEGAYILRTKVTFQ